MNRGFRVVNNTMYTYEQVRDALSHFYPKRKVLVDGVSTTPLDIQVFKLVKIDFLNNFLFLKFAYILLSKIVFRKYLHKIASNCK